MMGRPGLLEYICLCQCSSKRNPKKLRSSNCRLMVCVWVGGLVFACMKWLCVSSFHAVWSWKVNREEGRCPECIIHTLQQDQSTPLKIYQCQILQKVGLCVCLLTSKPLECFHNACVARLFLIVFCYYGDTYIVNEVIICLWFPDAY